MITRSGTVLLVWGLLAIALGAPSCAGENDWANPPGGDGDADADGGPGTEAPLVPPGGADVCNGIDDDLDRFVDEDCPCVPGATQACSFGAPETGVGACRPGTQQCFGTGDGEFGLWGPCEGVTGPSTEVCDDGVDDDCNGVVDDCDDPLVDPEPEPDPGDAGPGDDPEPDPGDAGPGYDPEPEPEPEPDPEPVEVPIFFLGDCVTVTCPAETPYPVGCNVMFAPAADENRGCVAHSGGSSSVYFQAGDSCSAGLIMGTLLCDTEPGPPLDMGTCAINRAVRYYVEDPSGCPQGDD